MSVRVRALDAGYRNAVRPLLFRVGGGDAEAAHHRTLRQMQWIGEHPSVIRALELGVPRPATPVELAGLHFPGRVGLAAGVDKDGVGVKTWEYLGFGHIELGTVTAHAQPGNPQPRLFRLRDSHAIINRMGFNNSGAQALAERLRAAGPVGIPIGVSIGKTKVTPVEDAIEDYLASLAVLDGCADYFAVNVSSPNTPGLRSLQDKGPLAELLTHLVRAAGERSGTPIFVKIAPDLTDGAIDDVLEVAQAAGASGVIATNTTLSRDGLAGTDLPLAAEAGGLSGAPLTRRARYVVTRIASTGGLPVIGVGGIMTADDGRALVDAGASLVQVYTGFIYRGPALVAELNRALAS
ncbi:quinone-dependent dihydroorotate dehydrogenase [Flexivirga caeni]|uniref:Dihydroorotate dehydrogenase (quinone) n=1 Tax=Flexivirga caeni TaxID=2294115 RepID=A0A3M9M9F6_9MICO|nr:quinone-dependent dihydroorotate dehydrogenase [Flexivirga caeni]RNI22174.1 quinone-dependent dihydroorotate dehydrogenase [Flexivirga caeni]